MAKAPAKPDDSLTRRSDAWTDLALTLPIFVVYHLGVVFLSIRNAADPITKELQSLADHSLTMYAVLTIAIGVAFFGVIAAVERRNPLSAARFALIAGEGALYAVVMRFAGAYAVGSLRLVGGASGTSGVFPSAIMALGAGFYEEVAFRVGLFGVGAWLLKRIAGEGPPRILAIVTWALIESAVFSGWHYVGSTEHFALDSFVFRAVCGLVLTTIFAFRGFAPAVWTHALYDLWAMLLQ
jgi:hypothetical protein